MTALRTKKSADLTLHDRLSRLTFNQVSQLLGPNGKRLLQKGGRIEIDIEEQVALDPDYLDLNLGDAIVTITLSPRTRDRLAWNCTKCDEPCEHVGAAFALILEDKTVLGLAAEPDESAVPEDLSDEDLVNQAIAERQERARTESMTLKSSDPKRIWTDYSVTSAGSGKTYRVALRGWDRGDSYCSCPDFRKNTLGTCKHILKTIAWVRRRFSAARCREPYQRKHIAVHLYYGQELELRLLWPSIDPPKPVARLLKPFRDQPIQAVDDLLQRIRKLEASGHEVRIYPDAEEYIQQWLFQNRIASKVDAIRNDPERHPLRTSLLKTELLPYQLDGIAFAVKAGRAVLADDMGLGKTIQGIGVAEMLALEAGIRKVLIICPASLKSQWGAEIARFSGRDHQLIYGGAAERADQYRGPGFFTVCNYEQVLRDVQAIEVVKWDLIILDEGQRIKNWEAKTSRALKRLKSRFALVLSGTPLENRLDDLYSVIEFIDDRRLGPAFRFFNRHRIEDERGKVLGYKNLDALRRRLQPVLLRRTRASVMQQLPERTSEIVRIPPTEEQLDINQANLSIVRTIVSKRYISEMDLLRMQKALLLCRMAADSTFLVDKEPPGFSTKLEKLDELLGSLAGEEDRKIVLFSEWTTMLNLIEPLLEKHGLRWVRLDGSVPQKKRQQLVHEFQRKPDCRVFITTNAGSTGLNLQAANTVINVDLPWNPAVLEQRIARAHRMGQKNKVHVFILVTEGTLEENMLTTLSAKHDLALAALDFSSEVEQVTLESGIEELKRRLEVLLGARAEAPVDESERAAREQETMRLAQQERIASAGGQLLSSAFAFLGELIPPAADNPAASAMADQFKSQFAQCLKKGDDGSTQLTVTVPPESLNQLADTLGRLLAAHQGQSRSQSQNPTR